MKPVIRMVRGRTVDIVEYIEGECPFCKTINKVRYTGEGADNYDEETCLHYDEDDSDPENLELIFKRKE
jgi:hypothetical protein